MLNLLESFFKVDLGEGAFYAVFGFCFVFLGIALLILIFSLLGWVMKRINGRSRGQTAREEVLPAPRAAERTEGEIPPEVVAAISAALAAYFEGTKEKCEFVVRRIKRL